MSLRVTTRAAGFTLIELMVTLAVAAVLLTVGVPSFVAFQRNSELSSAANSLLATLNATRGEAMKRNTRAMVVPLDAGIGWNSGWRAFVDVDQSGSLSAGDIDVATRPALPSYFSASATGIAAGTAPYAMFNGSGFAIDVNAGAGNFTITLQRNDLSNAAQLEQTRRIKMAVTGRARVCKPANSSDETCASSTND